MVSGTTQTTLGPRRTHRLRKKKKRRKMLAYVDFLAEPLFTWLRKRSLRRSSRIKGPQSSQIRADPAPSFGPRRKSLNSSQAAACGSRTQRLRCKKGAEGSVHGYVNSLLKSIAFVVTNIYPKKRDLAQPGLRERHAIDKKKSLAVIVGVTTVLLLTLLLKSFIAADRQSDMTMRNKVAVKPAVYYSGSGNTYLILGNKTKDIMVMSYKPLTKRIKAILIPKETFVEISEDGAGEISEAIDFGIPTTLETVKNLLGLDVKYYLFTKTDDLKILGTENLFEKAFTEATLSNLSDQKRLKIAEELAKVLPERIDIFPLPVRSVALHQEAYLEPKADKVEELVKGIWGEDSRPRARLMILNGSGRPGVGEGLAKKLTDEGFEVKSISNAESFDYDETRILVYRQKEAAEEIRDLLGIGVLVDQNFSPSSADITIVVGKNYLQ